MPDNQGNIPIGLVPFLAAWRPGRQGDRRSTQELAVRSFLTYARGGNIDAGSCLADSETSCVIGSSLNWEDWASHMLMDGYTLKTTLMYLKLLYALIPDKTAAVINAYDTVRHRVQEIGNSALEARPGRNVIGALRRLARPVRQAPAYDSLGADMLLFAVLSGGLSAAQLAEYPNTVPDASEAPDAAALREIALRYSRPRPARLFPLGASRTTAARRRSVARAHLARAMETAGLPATTTPADIFCHAVLEVTGSMTPAAAHARRLGAKSATFSLLRDTAPTLSAEEVQAHTRAVAAQVGTTGDVARWYALRMRPGASFRAIEAALALHPDLARSVSLYQPIREIERRVGHRLVTIAHAAIPGIFFLRCRATELDVVLRHVVGTDAWCYRTARAADAPYAIIPNAEIDTLRRAVEAMNPATVGSDSRPPELRPGDTVRVLSGAMLGRYARVELIERHGSDTLIRLTFPGAAPIHWTLTSPSLRLLNPAETNLQGS